MKRPWISIADYCGDAFVVSRLNRSEKILCAFQKNYPQWICPITQPDAISPHHGPFDRWLQFKSNSSTCPAEKFLGRIAKNPF